VAFVGPFRISIPCARHTTGLRGFAPIPAVVISIIQGFLPAVLLAVLFMLVPIVLRILARLEGIPQRTGVELSLMDRFFLFQVIVRASHVVPREALLINMSERLFGCHSLVRYYCFFA
jgi:hypothetical protein